MSTMKICQFIQKMHSMKVALYLQAVHFLKKIILYVEFNRFESHPEV